MQPIRTITIIINKIVPIVIVLKIPKFCEDCLLPVVEFLFHRGFHLCLIGFFALAWMAAKIDSVKFESKVVFRFPIIQWTCNAIQSNDQSINTNFNSRFSIIFQIIKITSTTIGTMVPIIDSNRKMNTIRIVDVR